MSDQHSRAEYVTKKEDGGTSNDLDGDYNNPYLTGEAPRDNGPTPGATPPGGHGWGFPVDPGKPGSDRTRSFAFVVDMQTGEFRPLNQGEVRQTYGPPGPPPGFDPGDDSEEAPSIGDLLAEDVRRLIGELHAANHRASDREYSRGVEERMAVAERLIDVAYPAGCCARCEAMRDILLAQNYAVGPLLTMIERLQARVSTLEQYK